MVDMRFLWLVLVLCMVTACNRVDVEPTREAPSVTPRQAAAGPARAKSWPRPPEGAPSVVFVTIDTLRSDHVGSYGASQAATPVLDGLAAEGLRFEEAFATAPLTLPSHASMMTGNYPPRHGVRHNGVFRLRDDAETLAEQFQASGWKTGAVIGALVLSRQFGLDQGFDHFDDAFGERKASEVGYQERSAEEVTDRALAWLAKTKGPYFLWVHYYDPHASYDPPAPHAARFEGRPYDGEIAYVDAELGRLVEGVKARGRWEQTHFAVTSDHGESLGEHGESTHGYFLYDSVLRVPLILRGPGITPGVEKALATNASLAPTLAGLAGIGGFDDTDAPSLFTSGDSVPVSPYSEALAAEFDFGWAPLYAIRDSAHSLIQSPSPELYEIESDAGQLENLWSEGAGAEVTETYRRLTAQIEAHLEDAQLARTTIDAETARQIEALGYMVTSEPVRRTGLNPRDGQRWIELSTGALGDEMNHRFAEAREKALAVVQEFPDSSPMHRVLARTALATGRPDQALPHAEALVRLQGTNADHHTLLGRVRLGLGDLKGALHAFEAGLKEDDGHYGAHLGAMWKLKAGASLRESQLHADEAIRLARHDVTVLEQVGEAWEGLGQYDLALKTYQQALAQVPDSQKIHMRLAIQHARLSDEATYRHHLSLAGKSAERPDMRNRLGITLAARGSLGEAETIFRALVADHPSNRLARMNLARVLDQAGRVQEAAAVRAESLPASAE